MSNLTVLNCDGCGHCCRNQPLPPMYSAYFYDHESLLTHEEIMWIDTLPDEAANELATAVHDTVDGIRSEDEPCFWLTDDGKCKHYEHRPQICRDFEMGGEDCLRMRAEAGL